MNCIKIKRIIDEADRPDVFPLEAAGHVAGCPDCQSFAEQRAKLRELTGSVARVTAPSNFNARLNERLSQVKSQKWSWLSPAGFLRLGTATAGLLVVFVAVEYGGFLSPRTPAVDEPTQAKAGEPHEPLALAPPTTPDNPTTNRSVSRITIPIKRGSTNRPVYVSRSSKSAPQDAPPAFLIRDVNGEHTSQIMTVSIGMQQDIRNGAYGRQLRSDNISY